MKVKKLIFLIFSLFLFTSCVCPFFNNSENKKEYKKELENLETLLKEISEENKNELKNLGFNSNENFENIKNQINENIQENKENFTLKIRIKANEKELNDFLDEEYLLISIFSREQGYKVSINKDYWENTGYSLGNDEYYKIEFFYVIYLLTLPPINDNYDKEYDILFSFTDIVTGKKDFTFSSQGKYYGKFFTAYIKKEQWNELKEQINKAQEAWCRIENKNSYETETADLVKKYLEKYEKYKHKYIELTLNFYKI